MKRYLLDIVLFFVLVLGIAVVADLIVSHGLRQTTIRKYAAWNDIYNGNNLDNDMVLLGSSACWAQLNTEVLDSILGTSSYNLGLDGHAWYPCEELRYTTYVRYARKPKYVIIIIDDASFERDKQPYEREQFFPYFWLDDSLVSQVRECKEITWMDRYCPMWRYIGYREDIETGVASTFGKKKFEDDGMYKGFRGNAYAWSRASLDIYDSLHLDVDTFVVNTFIRFIEQRKAEGQTVVLVNRPEYYELQDLYTNREEMVVLYDSVAKVAGVDMIDYWRHPITETNTYFYNSTHLNKEGADIMSAILAHDLDSLLNIRDKR